MERISSVLQRNSGFGRLLTALSALTSLGRTHVRQPKEKVFGWVTRSRPGRLREDMCICIFVEACICLGSLLRSGSVSREPSARLLVMQTFTDGSYVMKRRSKLASNSDA